MEVLDNEKEQLAEIKAWIRENGPSLVLGAVLGLGGVYGWRWWQGYKVSQSEQYSAQLAEAVDQIRRQQYEAGSKIIEKMIAENPGALYKDMARLVIAGARVKQGLLDEAVKPLKALLSDSKTSELTDIARIRLARIYLAKSEYDQARQLVKGQSSKAYAKDYEELRGDIAFFSDDLAAAKQAYQNAVALASKTDDIQFLQMKLDDLPSAGE